ncbi:MAG: phosphatase PAP2 family protein [Halobacteriota archaeon]
MSTNREISGTHNYKQFARECRSHIMLILLVFALYMTQVPIQQEITSASGYYDGTPVIEAIESDTVHLFQEGIYPSLTYLMSFSYLAIYIGAIMFTFAILAYYRQMLLFKRFSLMFSLNYLIAFPFFMFFNVSVAGASLQTVQPLMYEQFPRILSAIIAIDPLDNCFPSLHVTMVLSAFLIIRSTHYKRHKTFLGVGVPTIVFSVLYLGIHWITDVIGGMALALFTYYVAKSVYKSPV